MCETPNQVVFSLFRWWECSTYAFLDVQFSVSNFDLLLDDLDRLIQHINSLLLIHTNCPKAVDWRAQQLDLVIEQSELESGGMHALFFFFFFGESIHLPSVLLGESFQQSVRV